MYKVGDRVWLASCEMRSEKETCQICFGKLKVKLILGNGDEVILPCEYCGKGCDYPRGYHTIHVIKPRVELLTITGIHIDNDNVEYISTHRCLDTENTFTSEAEAWIRAGVLIEEDRIRRETTAAYLKENQQKNYSWNAGYHLRNAKDARKQAEYHEKMAVLCKAKAEKHGGKSCTSV